MWVWYMLVIVPQNNLEMLKKLDNNRILRTLPIFHKQKLKSPIAWKAKNLGTYKFYIKLVIEPVVIIFVHLLHKGGQKVLTFWYWERLLYNFQTTML